MGYESNMKLRKTIPLWWVMLAAETALVLRRHWGSLDPHSRQRMREIVTKSKGRPDKLTREERRELMGHVRKLDLRALARDIGEVATPVRLTGRRRRRRH